MLSLLVFFYEHTTQLHKQIFFKREKLSITTQEAAERSETIFHDAQIITVMSAVQLTRLLATPAVNIRLQALKSFVWSKITLKTNISAI